MKQTLNIILFFFFLHSCVYSQLNIDVESFELQNVEKLIIEDELGNSQIYYCNEARKVKTACYSYDESLRETYQYFYNADGRIDKELSKYENSNSDKTHEIDYVYEFDSQNLLRKKILIYDNKDSILYVYKSYNNSNLPAEYFQYAPDKYNNRIITNLEYENNKITKRTTLWVSDSSKTTAVYKYNEFGDIIQVEGKSDFKSKSNSDSSNVFNQAPLIRPLKNFIRHYAYEYDIKGRPTKVYRLENGEKVLYEKREYYDKTD